MNPDRQQAIDYLRAPANGLWHWAEEGKVLVWKDGSTIAFREEIVQILEWLAPNGLPSFGALVFLLAAGRGKLAKVADVVAESSAPLPPKMGRDASILLSARQQLRAQLEAALAQLARVADLPVELHTGIKARCILAEAVFEPARNERHVQAAAVLAGWRESISDGELLDSEAASATGRYLRQIHIVAEGLKLHSTDSLALRLRTGLDRLPEAVDLHLPVAERARRLIEELSQDRECGAVARAARELLAAVRLPRRLADREQLAIGGVADITNRGPLDRLLLSELAHDDLTLATRVALNEALYLRREPPLREPPSTLALLLDSGVRLWGIPRVLATAVALALVARDQQHSHVVGWRAHGRGLQSLDLLTRGGLTQHLAALETEPHPGNCLAAFTEAIGQGDHHQSVLITHRDALEDGEFRRALSEAGSAPSFIATVDRAGRFELHALPLAHRPPLCEADLDLTAVFATDEGVGLVRSEIDPNLPAIFGVHPFPFLLPIAGKLDTWCHGDDSRTYATLNDRRLVSYRDQKFGARILASELPGGRTLWMEHVAGVVSVVKSVASQRPARLISFALPEGPLRVTDLVAGEEVLAVHRYGEVILLIRKHDVRAYALSDGRLLHRTITPHRWMNGRFFRGEENFYFAAWDGAHVKLEPVTLPADCLFHHVVSIFDRAGFEGPWVVSIFAYLICTASGEKISLGMPSGFASKDYAVTVSRDGNTMQLAVEQLRWQVRFELEAAQNAKFLQGKISKLPLESPRPFPIWNLFRVVESLARVNDGLAICGRRGKWRKLTLGADGKLRLASLSERGNELWQKVTFTGQAKPTRQLCLLQNVAWPGGSTAWLDSRGLLHLQSHDPSVPEISLVLADGEVAGWTSDGYVCGPPFFIEGSPPSQPEHVFERLRQFLAKL